MNVIAESRGENWTLLNADSAEVLREMPERSADLIVTSIPYSNLYCYSASERDLGNCKDDAEFFAQYSFFAREMLRVLRPGRLACIECKDLVDYAGRDGRAGLRDFPGEVIRVHERAGFKWHSKATIWRDPVVEMQKTKAHGLLYKQLRADSTFSRMGMPVYVLMFRKWAECESDAKEIAPVTHTREEFPLEQWQRWASPIWSDVDFTNTLNAAVAREASDEKHLAAMPLDIIERCIGLYSNPGEVVLDPFGGVGSVGYQALKMGRKACLVELKASYYELAARYMREAETVHQGDLFAATPRAAS